MITLFNASDETQLASIRPSVLTMQQAWRCDLFGKAEQEISMVDYGVEVSIEARRLMTLKMKMAL